MIKISGKVIKGQQYGRKLGFPTVNIDRRMYVRQQIKTRLGVYAGFAELASGKQYRAAIVIGPIDNAGLPKLEAHILGFTGNLYGKVVTIGLEKYIRPFRKFKNENELKRQITDDVALVKRARRI